MVRLDLRGRPSRLARLSNKEDQQEEGLIDWLKVFKLRQLVIPAKHFLLFLLVCFRMTVLSARVTILRLA